MKFPEIIAALNQYLDEPQQPFVIDNSWTQGRTVYGGMSSALLLAAISRQVSNGMQVKNINVNFVGPLAANEPVTFTVQELRTGKNVSQWLAFAQQNGQTCTMLQACFVKDRASKISINNAPSHAYPAPQKAQFIPQIPKVIPKFLQHFDLCIQAGGFPYTGAKTDYYQGWYRHKKLTGTMDAIGFIGMLDALPPTVYQMLRLPKPGSTINWNVEFIHPFPTLDYADWIAFDDQTVHAENSYSATESKLWTADGQLIALSRQTIAVFD